MSEAEKAQPSTSAHPYSSFDSPSPGLPSIQQSAPTQFPPQQPLAVQTQPPPLTGPQYYTQLAYPAVSGTGNAFKEGLVTHSPTPTHTHYPSPPLTLHSHRWSWHLNSLLWPHSRLSQGLQNFPPNSPSMPL